MKRIFILLVILCVAAGGAFAQTNFSFNTFQSAFTQFAQDVANSLPFNAAVGLNWSDAYIGQLINLPPHFGIGVTTGATTIPFTTIDSVMTALRITSLPSQLEVLRPYGFPIPAYTADARIGGFILPFDIGLKVGYIPQGFLPSNFATSFDVNYLLAGADIRFAILKNKGIVPALSIGAGYTFMNAGIAVPDLLSGNIDIASFQVPNASGGFDTHSLALTNPSLDFKWSTNVIDLKAQVSWNLVIISLSAGAGVSYGISEAGGGLSTSLLLDGAAPTAAQIDQINTAFAAQGQSINLSQNGFLVQASQSGWAVRAFGGISLNIFVIRLDIGAMYNFTSGSYGATVNLRFQL